MNNGCEFYADALIDHAAGLLEEGRVARLDAHLGTCPECRDALRTVHALRAAPLEVPAGLEARIQSAVRQAAGHNRRSAPARWRPLALPFAAAAALMGIWIGVGTPGVGTADTEDPSVALVDDDYNPYGSWPAEGVIVAGDPLLSELSVEELEVLLLEMGS